MKQGTQDLKASSEEQREEVKTLDEVYFELPYVPDFLLEEAQLWFAPERDNPTAVYLELTGDADKHWSTYYSKKGWNFVQEESRPAEGPYQATNIHISILEPGRLFAPKPTVRFAKDGKAIPIVSLEKRRPINPWKPNYIQALNFIKKYEWQHSLPRSAQHAVWEIEECGQVAGSTSWKNAVRILKDLDSKELRLTLSDIFYNRPEDYPLGSEVYLRVLGQSGTNGFTDLLELAKHPISRKRKIVANTLGELKNPRGVDALLELLEDEDPEVRTAALRGIGRVGVNPDLDPENKVARYLESEEVSKRVWAAQATLKGGDKTYEKFLITLVKDEPRLLTDMGELGDVLADLNLIEAVPYCINRLKHPKAEYRADAAEALGKVTGLNLEYQSMDNEELRRKTIKAYTRWWEEKKRERRLSRGMQNEQ